MFNKFGKKLLYLGQGCVVREKTELLEPWNNSLQILFQYDKTNNQWNMSSKMKWAEWAWNSQGESFLSSLTQMGYTIFFISNSFFQLSLSVA